MIPHWIGALRTEEGRVIRQTRNGVEVVLNPECTDEISCATCGGKESCAHADTSIVCTVDEGNADNAKHGDRVKIRRFVLNRALAAFFLFGSPIVCGFLAVVLQQSLSETTGESVWTVVAFAGGMCAGFLFGAGIDRIVKNLVPPPKVVSTIPAETIT